jgi:hypothetical protein
MSSYYQLHKEELKIKARERYLKKKNEKAAAATTTATASPSTPPSVRAPVPETKTENPAVNTVIDIMGLKQGDLSLLRQMGLDVLDIKHNVDTPEVYFRHHGQNGTLYDIPKIMNFLTHNYNTNQHFKKFCAEYNCIVFYKALHHSVGDALPHCTLYFTNTQNTKSTRAYHLWFDKKTQKYSF